MAEACTVEGDQEFEPTLKNIIDQTSLKWIFVTGKGGVGKTTVSCSLAIQLSKVRDRVLIVSTDPAHNLSDAFSQKFTYKPSRVHGFSNLYALELEIRVDADSEATDYGDHLGKDIGQVISQSVCGLDEVQALFKLLELAKKNDYSVVVFDTAPTSYTLRLLAAARYTGQFANLTETFGKWMSLFAQMGAFTAGDQTVSSLMSSMFRSLTSFNKETLFKAFQRLQDANHTTFVCVCLAEFSPLYETERLVQDLCRNGVDSHNIVVNQLNIWPTTQLTPCSVCSGRHKIQRQYLLKIQELYKDFHVTKVPFMTEEVRGVDKLWSFSEHLLSTAAPGQ